MKEKWKRSPDESVYDGQPIAKRWNTLEPIYKPKLLTHSPSLRAIRNYNELPIDKHVSDSGYDNSAFQTDYRYEDFSYPNFSVTNGSNSKTSNFDYPTMSTVSIKTNSAESEINSSMDATEMGSSVKLVTEKVERSCKTWCTYITTNLCTISLAAGLGNLYRLPQTTLIHGGLPFLVIYVILTVIVGLPLLFLELGVGQMAQEGYIRCWRAVPFFKGIGYIKLLAGLLLTIYYPLYIGLAFLYMVWVLKGPIPFPECANGVTITPEGYIATTKLNGKCLRETFIQSPFQNPFYFGLYAAVLFVVWVLITIFSVKRTKSFIRCLLILFLPIFICYVVLLTKFILMESETPVLYQFFNEVDWNLLSRAEIWYYAMIQVFFSTHIGFGPFVTSAGTLYNKLNPLRIAVFYTVTNLLLGIGMVVILGIVTQNNTTNVSSDGVAEVHLFSVLYKSIVERSNTESDFAWWMVSTYLLFIFSGLISLATLMYSSLKAIFSHDGIRMKQWQISLIFSFSAFVLSCLLLLKSDFALVHLLDHYVVGNLVLITVVVEVIAFVAFYGTAKLQSDLEFILGRPLWKIWTILWWLIPISLTVIFVWGLIRLSLDGIFTSDPVWVYAVGWSVVLTAFILIFALGIFVVRKQDGYTTLDKLKASLEPSHNWGPTDPMLRLNWVQWNSKSQTGEKDFTLKRRGTKDYTRTIKKKAKKEANELSAMSIAGAYFQTDDVVVRPSWSDSSNGNPRISRNSNSEPNRMSNGGNYDQLYYVSHKIKTNIQNGIHSLPDSSLIDSLEKDNPKIHQTHRNTNPTNTTSELTNDEISEGYGTFRNKGPYIIEGGDAVGHVCQKKFNANLETTEL